MRERQHRTPTGVQRFFEDHAKHKGDRFVIEFQGKRLEAQSQLELYRSFRAAVQESFQREGRVA